MKKINWTSNEGDEFESKADAFEWMNNQTSFIDCPRIYCNGTLTHTRNPFGIFDEMTSSSIKGNLPVERYKN